MQVSISITTRVTTCALLPPGWVIGPAAVDCLSYVTGPLLMALTSHLLAPNCPAHSVMWKEVEGKMLDPGEAGRVAVATVTGPVVEDSHHTRWLRKHVMHLVTEVLTL